MSNKKYPKIVFFGTPGFAVCSLDAIVKAGYEVAAVVTVPDKPAGRGKKIHTSAVKDYALEHELPLLQPVKLRDESFLEALRATGADLFVIIAFRMLPEAVWAMPPLGTFNLHASLLPLYRGAAPINWAVINGETRTGVTTFFLDHEIDTGDIIDRVAVDIDPADNVGDVHDRLMELGASLTVKTIAAIAAGTLERHPQSGSNTVPTAAPKLTPANTRIDWTRPAAEIHNLVRGLSPYPGAWTTLSAKTSPPQEFKIYRTVPAARPAAGAPGTFDIDRNRLYIACGDGTALEVAELKPAGKRSMGADAWLRGARLTEPSFV